MKVIVNLSAKALNSFLTICNTTVILMFLTACYAL